MIGLVVSGDDTTTQQAFLEECPRGVVVKTDTPLDQAVAGLRAAGVSQVVPGTPGAASFADQCARSLGQQGLTVPLDRTNFHHADQRLPAGYISLCESAADVERAMARLRQPVLLRSSRFGDSDETVVCATADGVRDAWALFSTPRSVIAVGAGSDRRFSVDVVSRGGAHVSAGVYEHRVDLREGRQLLRHRLSLSPEAEAAVTAYAYARSCLDGLGVRDGATCVEIELTAAGPRLVDVLPAPSLPAVPADAAFSAFGHSHQHLYVESLLRPREFERRIARPLTPGTTSLAVSLLWNWKGNGADGLAGLRLLRRLTGFHGVTIMGAPQARGKPVGIASFVHPDRVSVENSLTILHAYEDSHGFFQHDDELIGFAATAS